MSLIERDRQAVVVLRKPWRQMTLGEHTDVAGGVRDHDENPNLRARKVSEQYRPEYFVLARCFIHEHEGVASTKALHALGLLARLSNEQMIVGVVAAPVHPGRLHVLQVVILRDGAIADLAELTEEARLDVL